MIGTEALLTTMHWMVGAPMRLLKRRPNLAATNTCREAPPQHGASWRPKITAGLFLQAASGATCVPRCLGAVLPVDTPRTGYIAGHPYPPTCSSLTYTRTLLPCYRTTSGTAGMRAGPALPRLHRSRGGPAPAR